jgi:hypothetical protein
VDQAISAVDSIWETTKDYAMDSLVSIPEIIPDRYPPGSDDHGIPIETNIDSIPEHEVDTNQDHPSTPDPEGDTSQHQSAEPDSEGEYVTGAKGSRIKKGRPLHLLDLPTESDIRSRSNTKSNSDENEMKNRRLLQWWHERLGHISMHTIQHMASKGLLPAGIAKCKVPTMHVRHDDQTPMEDKSGPKTNEYSHHRAW